MAADWREGMVERITHGLESGHYDDFDDQPWSSHYIICRRMPRKSWLEVAGDYRWIVAPAKWGKAKVDVQTMLTIDSVSVRDRAGNVLCWFRGDEDEIRGGDEYRYIGGAK